MAGVGKRMRPHTLTTPKPMIPVAGKPIVQRIVEDIAALTKEKINNIGFVIGDYDDEVKAGLLKIAKNIGAKGKTFHQVKAEGPGHAVLCAEELLKGKFQDGSHIQVRKKGDSLEFLEIGRKVVDEDPKGEKIEKV